MRALGVGLGLLVMSGCRVPDLKPFSDATTGMVAVLTQGFERSRAALAAAADAADDKEAFAAQLRRLDEVWTPTRRALAAVVAYSDSLAALAEAGKKGPETMARLTGAVNDLATAVSVIPIPAAGVGVVNAVGARIIEMQAARDIRKATDAAGGAVEIIAPVLEQTFADLRRLHGAAQRAHLAQVAGESSILTGYYQSLEGEQERLEHLLNLIVDYQSSPARWRWRAARARAQGREDEAAKLDAAAPTDQRDLLGELQRADLAFNGLHPSSEDAAAKVEARQLQLMALLSAHRQELARLEPRFAAARAREREAQSALLAADLLLATAGDGIGAWLKAHRSVRAPADGRQSRPSVADLLLVTQELHTLVN